MGLFDCELLEIRPQEGALPLQERRVLGGARVNFPEREMSQPTGGWRGGK